MLGDSAFGLNFAVCGTPLTGASGFTNPAFTALPEKNPTSNPPGGAEMKSGSLNIGTGFGGGTALPPPAVAAGGGMGKVGGTLPWRDG